MALTVNETVPLRIATWNITKLNKTKLEDTEGLLAGICQVVRANKFDIVAIQEVLWCESNGEDKTAFNTLKDELNRNDRPTREWEARFRKSQTLVDGVYLELAGVLYDKKKVEITLKENPTLFSDELLKQLPIFVSEVCCESKPELRFVLVSVHLKRKDKDRIKTLKCLARSICDYSEDDGNQAGLAGGSVQGHCNSHVVLLGNFNFDHSNTTYTKSFSEIGLEPIIKKAQTTNAEKRRICLDSIWFSSPMLGPSNIACRDCASGNHNDTEHVINDEGIVKVNEKLPNGKINHFAVWADVHPTPSVTVLQQTPPMPQPAAPPTIPAAGSGNAAEDGPAGADGGATAEAGSTGAATINATESSGDSKAAYHYPMTAMCSTSAAVDPSITTTGDTSSAAGDSTAADDEVVVEEVTPAELDQEQVIRSPGSISGNDTPLDFGFSSHLEATHVTFELTPLVIEEEIKKVEKMVGSLSYYFSADTLIIHIEDPTNNSLCDEVQDFVEKAFRKYPPNEHFKVVVYPDSAKCTFGCVGSPSMRVGTSTNQVIAMYMPTKDGPDFWFSFAHGYLKNYLEASRPKLGDLKDLKTRALARHWRDAISMMHIDVPLREHIQSQPDLENAYVLFISRDYITHKGKLFWHSIDIMSGPVPKASNPSSSIRSGTRNVNSIHEKCLKCSSSFCNNDQHPATRVMFSILGVSEFPLKENQICCWLDCSRLEGRNVLCWLGDRKGFTEGRVTGTKLPSSLSLRLDENSPEAFKMWNLIAIEPLGEAKPEQGDCGHIWVEATKDGFKAVAITNGIQKNFQDQQKPYSQETQGKTYWLAFLMQAALIGLEVSFP